MTLGERLAELRAAKKVSLSNVAKATGISRGYLHLLEHDARISPTLGFINRIACYYGMHVSALLLPVTFLEREAPEQILPFDERTTP